MPDLKSLYESLQRAFYATPSDYKACSSILSQLKLGLIEAGLLIPQGNPDPNDLIVARDILEIGALSSIRSKDVPSFDRYFAQLQTFYTDFRSLPGFMPSKREYTLRGLNLIRLLTQNRIADFHTTLESLPTEVIAENPFIKHPANLERWLMEGSYSKVWNAREEAPAEEYKIFIDSLMGTIRNEIASCEEAAYESLPIKDAATLLFFNNQTDLSRFAQERGWQIDLTGGLLRFSQKGEETQEIPKQKLIAASLMYARELEQIV